MEYPAPTSNTNVFNNADWLTTDAELNTGTGTGTDDVDHSNYLKKTGDQSMSGSLTLPKIIFNDGSEQTIGYTSNINNDVTSNKQKLTGTTYNATTLKTIISQLKTNNIEFVDLDNGELVSQLRAYSEVDFDLIQTNKANINNNSGRINTNEGNIQSNDDELYAQNLRINGIDQDFHRTTTILSGRIGSANVKIDQNIEDIGLANGKIDINTDNTKYFEPGYHQTTINHNLTIQDGYLRFLGTSGRFILAYSKYIIGNDTTGGDTEVLTIRNYKNEKIEIISPAFIDLNAPYTKVIQLTFANDTLVDNIQVSAFSQTLLSELKTATENISSLDSQLGTNDTETATNKTDIISVNGRVDINDTQTATNKTDISTNTGLINTQISKTQWLTSSVWGPSFNTKPLQITKDGISLIMRGNDTSLAGYSSAGVRMFYLGTNSSDQVVLYNQSNADIILMVNGGGASIRLHAAQTQLNEIVFWKDGNQIQFRAFSEILYAKYNQYATEISTLDSQQSTNTQQIATNTQQIATNATSINTIEARLNKAKINTEYTLNSTQIIGIANLDSVANVTTAHFYNLGESMQNEGISYFQNGTFKNGKINQDFGSLIITPTINFDTNSSTVNATVYSIRSQICITDEYSTMEFTSPLFGYHSTNAQTCVYVTQSINTSFTLNFKTSYLNKYIQLRTYFKCQTTSGCDLTAFIQVRELLN